MGRSNTFLAAGLTLSLVACGGNAVKPEHASTEIKPSGLNNSDLYEVSHEGRLYVFDDFGTYQEFVSVGETAFRQTFIGAGPKGETLVFGVTGQDKKKPADKVASYNLFYGNLEPATPFYGEMRLDGRIYVFDNLKDMESVRTTGEAALRYTEIGAGPAGETLVYVLRSDNKKQKPVALQAAFAERNKRM